MGHCSSIKLFGTKEQITWEVNKILQSFKDQSFILNLGHGILPATPIENVELLLESVKK
jgi:uroporphyrinogen decarboxylase